MDSVLQSDFQVKVLNSKNTQKSSKLITCKTFKTWGTWGSCLSIITFCKHIVSCIPFQDSTTSWSYPVALIFRLLHPFRAVPSALSCLLDPEVLCSETEESEMIVQNR